ncbi:MAG: hypothetical protein V1753_00955 [Pseudomonadota bacterium]
MAIEEIKRAEQLFETIEKEGSNGKKTDRLHAEQCDQISDPTKYLAEVEGESDSAETIRLLL